MYNAKRGTPRGASSPGSKAPDRLSSFRRKQTPAARFCVSFIISSSAIIELPPCNWRRQWHSSVARPARIRPQGFALPPPPAGRGSLVQDGRTLGRVQSQACVSLRQAPRNGTPPFLRADVSAPARPARRPAGTRLPQGLPLAAPPIYTNTSTHTHAPRCLTSIITERLCASASCCRSFKRKKKFLKKEFSFYFIFLQR